jgi:hypothetical protein
MVVYGSADGLDPATRTVLPPQGRARRVRLRARRPLAAGHRGPGR